MSKNELRLGLFIIKHRDDEIGDNKMRYCQDLMCDTMGKEPKNKEKIVELLKYMGHLSVIGQFEQWILPKFPINGIALLEAGIPTGPELATALDTLKQKWKDSNYTFTEKELMELAGKFKQQEK